MRVFNFSAGPSTLPIDVLEKIKSEFTDYNGSGMSVTEMSHRGKVFLPIAREAESLLRELMGISDDYHVLFLQGGASTQFSAIPLNLMKSGKADYIVTGSFASKAQKECMKFGEARIVASSKDKDFTYIPEVKREDFDSTADYVHYTANNTIYGTRFSYIPDAPTPLVSDMSSFILSEPVDVSRFGLIYAGAQKNIAPAGLTVVIVRKDLASAPRDICPTILRYDIMAENESMYNTPPCFPIYVMKLVLSWLKDKGGVQAISKINKEKAKLLYDFIDGSDFYTNRVEKKDRSLMNVPFFTSSPELDDKFCKEAEQNGIVSIKGHRLVGGMRASIYNAMPVEGVQALIAFMKKFELENK